METSTVAYYTLDEILEKRIHSVWVEAGFYNDLTQKLKQADQRMAELVTENGVLTATNNRLATLTAGLQLPKMEMTLKEGRCDCTCRVLKMRCDNCGRTP